MIKQSWVDVDRHGKGKSDVHSRRVGLHGYVDEALETGELDDVVEATGNVAATHAEDRGVEEHVVAPGQLRMETGAELEQGRHPLVHAHAAGVRLQDAGHALQQRRLARPVLADHTEDLTFVAR